MASEASSVDPPSVAYLTPNCMISELPMQLSCISDLGATQNNFLE